MEFLNGDVDETAIEVARKEEDNQETVDLLYNEMIKERKPE